MITKHLSYAGQIVWINTGKKGKVLGKIIKINRVNIKVQDEAGLTYTADPFYLSETSTEDAALWSPTGTAAGSVTDLFTGQVVKFKSGRSGLYVVLGAHSGAYRVAKLGGDKGRYIRGVLPTSVEVVTFELAGV